MYFVLRKLKTDGMYPTLERGQYILIHKTDRAKVSDVIAYTRSNREYVKRVAGVEGEFLYVLGDNPRFSTDSRQFGYVPANNVIGKVVWPRV